jgi:hypothetical protein
MIRVSQVQSCRRYLARFLVSIRAEAAEAGKAGLGGGWKS